MQGHWPHWELPEAVNVQELYAALQPPLYGTGAARAADERQPTAGGRCELVSVKEPRRPQHWGGTCTMRHARTTAIVRFHNSEQEKRALKDEEELREMVGGWAQTMGITEEAAAALADDVRAAVDWCHDRISATVAGMGKEVYMCDCDSLRAGSPTTIPARADAAAPTPGKKRAPSRTPVVQPPNKRPTPPPEGLAASPPPAKRGAAPSSNTPAAPAPETPAAPKRLQQRLTSPTAVSPPANKP
eukprot:gene1386-5847_t